MISESTEQSWRDESSTGRVEVEDRQVESVDDARVSEDGEVVSGVRSQFSTRCDRRNGIFSADVRLNMVLWIASGNSVQMKEIFCDC